MDWVSPKAEYSELKHDAETPALQVKERTASGRFYAVRRLSAVSGAQATPSSEALSVWTYVETAHAAAPRVNKVKTKKVSSSKLFSTMKKSDHQWSKSATKIRLGNDSVRATGGIGKRKWPRQVHPKTGISSLKQFFKLALFISSSSRLLFSPGPDATVIAADQGHSASVTGVSLPLESPLVGAAWVLATAEKAELGRPMDDGRKIHGYTAVVVQEFL